MKLMVIDGNSIVNRAFYGVRMLTTRDGLPTNAVFGFVNILWKPPAGGPDSSGRGGRRRTFVGCGGPADPADGIFLFLRDFYANCLAL